MILLRLERLMVSLFNGTGKRTGEGADVGIDTPKHPIVLAHGLLGFDELRLAGDLLPGVHYWRGIIEAMKANGMEIITAAVPPSGSIEERAKKLGEDIAEKANGKSVNIIAHSMGGLD